MSIVISSTVPLLVCIAWFNSNLLVCIALSLCVVSLMVVVTPLFSSTLQSTLLDSVLFLDEVSFWLCFLSFVLVSLTIFSISVQSSMFAVLSLVWLLAACLVVFFSSKFLVLYFSFEVSLLPIMYIILNWGVYADRSKSVLYILTYTTFFSFPLLLVVLYMTLNKSSFILLANFWDPVSLWVALLIFMSFTVKLPIFGVHYWLPQAHVEAPTFGSIILAGILLNLGGYGLYRIIAMVELPNSALAAAISYLIVSIILSSLVTCYQSDFKRLIAYSSVVHMTSVVLLVLASNSLTPKVFVIVLLFHGLLSPSLFFLVNLVYLSSNTRILVLLTNINTSLLMLGSFVVIFFCMSIPTPPFPQFFFEVLIFISITTVSSLIFAVVVSYTFLSLIFNLVWFTPIVLIPSYSNVSSVVMLKDFYVVFLGVEFCVFMFFFILLI